MFAAVEPEIDSQHDRRRAEAIHQRPRLRILEHRRMLAQHFQGDFLSMRNRIVVADADREVFTAVLVAAEVADRALVDRRVRNRDLIAVQRHQHRRPHGQTLHVADDAGDLDQVPDEKRPLHAEKNAGEKVLRDVAKRDADHEPDDARCRRAR